MKLEPRVADYLARIVPSPGRHQDETEDDLITLRELVAHVWRGRWTIVASVLLCVAIAAFGLSRMGDRYRATASMMFGTPKANVVDLKEVLADPVFSKDTLQNEIEVLRSASLIERVITELDLADDAEFRPSEPRARRRGIFVLGSGLLRRSPPVAEAAAEDGLRTRLTVLDLVRQRLAVEALAGTRIIEISFTSQSRDTSAAVVNAIARRYISDQIQARTDTTRQAIQWLTGRVEDARRTLRTAEDAVETARTDLARQAGQSLEITQQQLVALTAAGAAARGETSAAETRFHRLTEAIRTDANLAAIPEFRASEAITAFRAEESDLAARLARISGSHPSARSLRQQLEAIRTRIHVEAGDIVAAAGNALADARDQERALSASVRALETKALAQSRSQLRLRQLDREADASRLIYETMLKRLKEASEQAELQDAGARILSPAEPPLEPESSRKRLILAMAAGIGALLGAALVFLFEQFNNTFRSAQEIEHLTGHAVLASVPTMGRGQRRGGMAGLLNATPDSAVAEAIRNLRTSILFSNVDHPPKVVLFTSSLPDEGKSTTALLTALTSCQIGKLAVLVDCDLRRPSAREGLGVEAHGLGLLSVLDGSATLSEAIYRDPVTGLHVLMSQPGEARAHVNAADILASNRFGELVATLAELYDLVVLDAPPALVVADARILSTASDTVVYALRWDHTPRGAVLEGLKELQSVNAPIAGVVVTMLDASKASRYAFDGRLRYRQRFRGNGIA